MNNTNGDPALLILLIIIATYTIYAITRNNIK
jgi:hypothetical protein